MNFWNTFYNLCTNVGKAPNAVAKELGISSASITWWKQGERNPSAKTLKKIADYFGITVEQLKGWEQQEKNNDALSDIVIRLRRDIKFFNTVIMLHNVNDEQLSLVENMLIAFKK